jgi:uncharacterized membrane protein
MEKTGTRSTIIALGVATLVLEAAVIMDLWQPGRAVATALLALLLPGLLLSYVVVPGEAPQGFRVILAVAGSLAISMFIGMFIAGFVGGVSRTDAGLGWAVATTLLSVAAIARGSTTH